MTTRADLHGIPAPPRSTSPTEPRRTVRWRRSQLLAAGYDELAARRWAADPDVDIHVLLNLVESAGKIAAPDAPARPGAYARE